MGEEVNEPIKIIKDLLEKPELLTGFISGMAFLYGVFLLANKMGWIGKKNIHNHQEMNIFLMDKKFKELHKMERQVTESLQNLSIPNETDLISTVDYPKNKIIQEFKEMKGALELINNFVTIVAETQEMTTKAIKQMHTEFFEAKIPLKSVQFFYIPQECPNCQKIKFVFKESKDADSKWIHCEECGWNDREPRVVKIYNKPKKY